MNALIDQMRRAAGDAHHWLAWVAQGNKPHMDGRDNTAAFVAHYQRQLSDATSFLRAHA